MHIHFSKPVVGLAAVLVLSSFLCGTADCEPVINEPVTTFGLGTLRCAAYSPDGAHVVTAGGDGIYIWNSATGSLLHSLKGHAEGISAVAFSPDGTQLLTGSLNGTARLWRENISDCACTFIGHTDTVTSVAFSPDGARVLTGSLDNTAKLWNAATGCCIRTFTGHWSDVNAVAFSPSGIQVVTGSDDGTAKLWDASSGSCIRTFEGHAYSVTSVAFSPGGTQVLTGSLDDTAKLWDADTGASIRTFTGHSFWVHAVAFSPDGAHVLTGSGDQTAKLWDAATGSCIRTFTRHRLAIVSVAFSPNGTQALTVSEDSTAKLWDTASGSCTLTLTGHTQSVYGVAFSVDGTEALTGSSDGIATLWQISTGSATRAFSTASPSITSVAMSPDGTKVLTGSNDKNAKMWDAITGAWLQMFTGHTSPVNSVAFSPDSAQVLTGSADRTAKLWDVSTRSCIRTFTGHNWDVTSVAFSPDGVQVLTGSDDGTAKLWDAATGACVRTFTNAESACIDSVAFSPDGTQVLTGDWDGTAKLWDAATGVCTRTFTGHTGAVSSAVFSPDGAQVLTGSHDKTAKLWDAATGSCIRTFVAHTSVVTSVAISPDGSQMLTGSSDGTAKLWHVGDPAWWLQIDEPEGSGTTGLEPGTYGYDTAAQVLATPAFGWWFSRWEGSAVGGYATDNPVTIPPGTAGEVKTLNAVFSPNAIEGHVYDAESNQAIPGAWIAIFHGDDPDSADEYAWTYVGSTLTDDNGFYRFEALESRSYCIRTSTFRSGDFSYYSDGRFNVSVQYGVTVTADFHLQRAGCIYGYVYDEAGNPLHNAPVFTQGPETEDSPDELLVWTEEDGSYELIVPPTEHRFYSLWCEGGGVFVPQVAPGLYSAETTGTRGPDFYMIAGGSGHGFAMTEDGAPIANTSVIVYTEGRANTYAATDENGEYHIFGLPPNIGFYLFTSDFRYEAGGKVYVSTWGERYIGPFTVAAGETIELPDLVFAEAGTVSGIVTDQNGTPMAGVEVGMCGTDVFGGTVWLEDEEGGAVTDDEGFYLIEAPPGTYTFLVREPLYELQPTSVTVERGQNTICDLQLTAHTGYVTVTGSIANFPAIAPTNEDGVPLPYEHDDYSGDVAVVAWRPDTEWTTGPQFFEPLLVVGTSVEDGYTDQFQPSDEPAGSFGIRIPPGAYDMVGCVASPESSNGWWVQFSDPLRVDGQPGQRIDGLSITIPIGTGKVTGKVIFPSASRGIVGEDSVAITLLEAGSIGGPGRSMGRPTPAGNYILGNLPAASYYLYAVTPGFEPFVSGTFSLSPGQTVIRNIVFGIAGDANLDCTVNILDLIFVRNRINRSIDTGDNWQADVTGDGKINILDLIFVRNNLNTKCPD